MIPGGYEKSKENLIDDYYDDDDDFNDEVFEITNSKTLFELNNNYDEKYYILEDLKSSILNQNLDKMINLMKSHTLDINCLLKSNWTPLMYAVNVGALQIVQHLLLNFADVNYSQGIYILRDFK